MLVQWCVPVKVIKLLFYSFMEHTVCTVTFGSFKECQQINAVCLNNISDKITFQSVI